MGDIDVVRCHNPACRGRWIVKVRRRYGGAFAVEWRRDSTIRFEQADDTGERWDVTDQHTWIAPFPPQPHDVVKWSIAGSAVRCGKCGRWTKVPTAV